MSGMFASGVAPTQRLKTYLGGGPGVDGSINMADAQPIADLFPNCTVYFSDIAGFTAWSSTREPAQVFVLLQAVYQGKMVAYWISFFVCLFRPCASQGLIGFFCFPSIHVV